ncbi:MAG TPA: response regulator transcription factor [Solirubrobacteraceae bacterium]|jgi:two-component system nitrate/nitrite response regulator NarL|nr:response regulator transcription factor [Solirubrobacteraceae bacterium]
MTEAPVRVLVADDHPLFREALAETIDQRPELELVGKVESGREALAAMQGAPPDVAVLDMKMPELDGMDVVDAVTRDELPTRVLLLSAFLDSALAYRALGAGAAGYLSKDSTGDRICEAVLAVAHGETVLDPEVQAGVAREIRMRAEDERPALTAREREILRMTADGCSAPQIAERLYLSPTTVRTHLQHLYEKLGVSDRAAAVAEAMRQRLLE